MPSNAFSCQHHQKRPNYCTHAKHHFFISFQPLSKRLKFWNLALQMPPGNPDESALQVERPKENTAVNATQGCQMLDRKYDKCLSNL